MGRHWANAWQDSVGHEPPGEARGGGLTDLGLWSSVALAAMSAADIAGGGPALGRAALLALWLAGWGLAELLARRGRMAAAGWALALAGWGVAEALQWLSGGLSSPSAAALVLVVALGGMVGGRRMAGWLAGMSAAGAALMWAAQAAGWRPALRIDASMGAMAAQQAGMVALALVGARIAQARMRKSQQAERAQRMRAVEAVESFQSLFVRSPAAMGLTEAGLRPNESLRRALAVNEAFEELFAVDAESALGTAGAQMELWGELGQLMEVRDLLNRDGHVDRYKAKMRTWGGGRRLSCLVSAKPVAWEGQTAVLWTFQDITENEQLREGMESLNQELGARVEQEAVELAQARKELARKERLAHLGGMVAGVAHEINTPIGNAMLAASALAEPSRRLIAMAEGESISRSELGKTGRRVGEAGELAMENLGRASDIIRSFKQLSVDQAGQARRVFDVAEVLNGAMLAAGAALKEKGASWRVESEAAARGLSVDGFPGALSQIVAALAENAAEHAFAGDKPKEGRLFKLEVSLASPGWARVAFSDNGSGLGEGMGERVFEPFFAGRAGRAGSGGAGLGLAIAWNLAKEALGGELGLEESGPSGCRFSLYMPLRAPSSGEEGQKA